MKTFQSVIPFAVAFVLALGISSCGNSKGNDSNQPVNSVADDTAATTSVVENGTPAVTDDAKEEAQSTDIDRQEIQDVIQRSIVADESAEKCFSVEYVRLMNQAAQVAEAGLWNVLPGSVYVPKTITVNGFDIQSADKATVKATLKAEDFEDPTDKQILKVKLSLIKENDKWVIDDVDNTKNDYRMCIKNAAE